MSTPMDAKAYYDGYYSKRDGNDTSYGCRNYGSILRGGEKRILDVGCGDARYMTNSHPGFAAFASLSPS